MITRIVWHPGKRKYLILLMVFLYSLAVESQVPMISQITPSTPSICVGTSGTLSVSATNNPTSFIWQSSPDHGTWTTITDDAMYSGSNTSTLTITPSNTATEFIGYRAIAVNGNGSSGASDYMDIQLAASIPAQPDPIQELIVLTELPDLGSVCQGVSVTRFYVTHPNEFWPLGATWSYSGTGATFLSGDTTAEINFGPGATSGTLSITAMNGCGSSIPQTVELNIQPVQGALPVSSDGSTFCTYVDLNYNSSGSYFDSSCKPINIVTPSGSNPVSGGSMRSCVTVDTSVQFYHGIPYVQRHYEVDLLHHLNSSVATSTATVTLYFTQTDFDNYNAVRGALPVLPRFPTDVVGISDVRITQLHGTGTTPNTFTAGSAGIIDPPDANIVWNAAQSRWEITFDITGFSGFFMTTGVFTALPLTLVEFTGKSADDGNTLQWETTSEKNVNRFEIERSTDGLDFVTIGQVEALNNSNNSANTYNYKDNFSNGTERLYYYRLKMLDIDNEFSFSNVIYIQSFSKVLLVGAVPNPFKQDLAVTISSPFADKGSVTIIDASGKVVSRQNISITTGANTIDVTGAGKLQNGIYLVRISTTTTNKIIKILKY